MLSKRRQGNYGSALCIWKSENRSLKSCGGSRCLSTLQEKAPVPGGNTNQLAGSRQPSALCHISPCGLPVTLSWAVMSTGRRKRKFSEVGVARQLSLVFCSSCDLQLIVQAGVGRRLFPSLFDISFTRRERNLGAKAEPPTCSPDEAAPLPRSGRQSAGWRETVME